MFAKQMKKLKLLDVALTKLAVAAFVIFVIAIWPAAMDLVHKINAWHFLAISLIIAAIVQFRLWKK